MKIKYLFLILISLIFTIALNVWSTEWANQYEGEKDWDVTLSTNNQGYWTDGRNLQANGNFVYGIVKDYVFKYTKEGTKEWIKQFDGFDYSKICVDDNEFAYITCILNNTLYIKKLNSMGDIISENNWQVSEGYTILDIQTDGTNLYIFSSTNTCNISLRKYTNSLVMESEIFYITAKDYNHEFLVGSNTSIHNDKILVSFQSVTYSTVNWPGDAYIIDKYVSEYNSNGDRIFNILVSSEIWDYPTSEDVKAVLCSMNGKEYFFVAYDSDLPHRTHISLYENGVNPLKLWDKKIDKIGTIPGELKVCENGSDKCNIFIKTYISDPEQRIYKYEADLINLNLLYTRTLFTEFSLSYCVLNDAICVLFQTSDFYNYWNAILMKEYANARGVMKGSVSPSKGNINDTYKYELLYKNIDSIQPLGGYPKIHILEDGNEISGSPFVMSLLGGDITSNTTYTYSISGVNIFSPQHIYTYRFECVDTLNNPAIDVDANSQSLRYYPKILPEDPNGFDLVSFSSSSATFKWNSVNAHHYEIVWEPNLQTGCVTFNTTFTCEYLTANTSYTFTLYSHNVLGIRSMNCCQMTIKTLPSSDICFAAANVSTSTIQWQWQDVLDGESGYRIKDSSNNIIADNLPANTTCWTQTGLHANNRYSRYVVSYNESGASEASNLVSKYTLAPVPKFTDADFSVYYSSVTISSVIIGLIAPGNDQDYPPTKYLVERANNNNGNHGDWITIKDWDNNTDIIGFTDTNLLTNTKYYYRFKSYNGDGVLNETPGNIISIVTLNSNINQNLIDQNTGGSVNLNSEKVNANVVVQPNTFNQNVLLTVSTGSISNYNSNSYTIPSNNLVIDITAEGNKQPDKEITITIYYKDSDVANIDENKLVICRYDSSTSKLIPLVSKVYPDLNKIEAKTNHLSKFVVGAHVVKTDLSSIKIYPNPFNPNKHLASFTFENLAQDTTIKIYTISGELVKTVDCSGNNGMAKWDGTNDSNKRVATGVYIALIKTPNETKKLKIAVEK